MICAVVMAAATPGDIAAIPVEHLLKIGMILAALAVLLSRSWKPRAYWQQNTYTTGTRKSVRS